MNGESKQQELAEAIGKVIIPMVETGDGIDDGPIQAFLLKASQSVLEDLQFAFNTKWLKPKQP